MTFLVDESEIDRRLASHALADTPVTFAVRALRNTRNRVPDHLRLQAELIRFCCISIALELLGDRALLPQVVSFCRPIRHMLVGKYDWLVPEFPNPDLPLERLHFELCALQRSYSARGARLGRETYARRVDVLRPITTGFEAVVLRRHRTGSLALSQP